MNVEGSSRVSIELISRQCYFELVLPFSKSLSTLGVILCSCSCSPKCSLPDYQHGYVVFICGDSSNFLAITENLRAQLSLMNCMTDLQWGRRHRGDREAACLPCQVSQQSWDSSSSLMRQWVVLTFWYIWVQSSQWRFCFPQPYSDAGGYLRRAPISAGEGQGEGEENIRALQCLMISLQCWWVLWGPKEEQVCSSQTSRCVPACVPVFQNAAEMLTN